MNSLGPGELRLLRRLAIDPTLRQAELARELNVSRSAVNQAWKKLEDERNLAVRGSLDYGQLGLQMIFGWASGPEGSDILSKFSSWLRSSSFVTRMTQSVMSSMMDARVYFEAVIPLGSSQEWFQSQIDRFTKRPYSLSIQWGVASGVSHHLNLGIFDGASWTFSNDFRFEASIGAAKGNVEVLPVVGTVEQSEAAEPVLEDLVYAAAIADNFFVSAPEVAERFIALDYKTPGGRTIRRNLSRFRATIARPYLELANVGLVQKLMLCLRDPDSSPSQLSRLLQAQASTFPQSRVISSSGLTVLDLGIPANVDWLTMSQILSGLAGKSSEICTFIANHHEIQKRLESVVTLFASRARSQ